MFSTVSYATDDDLEHLQVKLTNQWQLIKYDKLRDIKTYAKQEDGHRFRSFKVESNINSSMKNIVQLLADFDNYKKLCTFMNECSSNELELFFK